MKNFAMMSLIIFLFLTACGGKEDSSKISIAILTPVTHPSLEQIEKGFIQTMEERNPDRYNFVVYNAQGNKTLMRSEIEEIVRKNYALVFTIGTSASQMATEVLSKKGLSTPVVFTGVNDPVGFNIVASEVNPGGSVTGVKEELNFNEELSALFHFKPAIQTVLLVYNPTEPGLQKDRNEVARILQEMQKDLIAVEVFKTNEILSKTSPFMEKADAVIVLKDNTVISGLDVLVKLCKRHQIPLMASDLDSPDKGAAFGYGVYESQFGVEAAKKALQILVEGTFPGDIPVTPISHFELKINHGAAKAQGIRS